MYLTVAHTSNSLISLTRQNFKKHIPVIFDVPDSSTYQYICNVSDKAKLQEAHTDNL
jgi:hypothetical protein